MAISVVSFSFSRVAQLEGRSPTLLDAGFLYRILSPTGLQTHWGCRGAPPPGGGFFYYIFCSDFSGPQLIRGPNGPLRRALSTTSYQQPLWTPTVWLSVLTELYNSSTPTQLPTQTLKWHVWSSSSGNNCHAVHRSLSSGASVYECTMGFFYLVPFHQPNPPTRSLSITGHWNVSLPSGASLWNGMFGRVEGQNTT